MAASVMQSNFVNGSDLLLFESAEQLVQDLRVTPSAARKVLALRNTFLTRAPKAGPGLTQYLH